MPYGGREIPKLNLQQRFRHPQTPQEHLPQSVHEDGIAEDLIGLSLTSTHAQHHDIRDLPSFVGPLPSPAQEDSLQLPRPSYAEAARGSHSSHERLDVPRSVSPGRTPVGSPRRAEQSEWHHSPSETISAPPPLPIEAVNSEPAAFVPPYVDGASSMDPIRRGIDDGYRALNVLRFQRASVYENDEQQQLHDWCALRNLKTSLESWGLSNELQQYHPQHHPYAPTSSFAGEDRPLDWSVQTSERLRQLRQAMQWRPGAGGDSRSASPQHEFRDMPSPSLSRNSSSASGRSSLRQYFAHRHRTPDTLSGRSSLSGDSLFSRESIASSVSAISSAASAASVPMTDPTLTRQMIEPILADLRSIQRDEWTFEQCSASLPSILLRIEGITVWLWSLQLRLRRIQVGVGPVGSVPPIDLRPRERGQ